MRKSVWAICTATLLCWQVPSMGRTDGKIAFQSNRDGQWEIYVMGRDGSGQTNLSRSAHQDIDPAWSPDGSQIAFASDRKGNFQIFVMQADGTDLVQLTAGAGQHVWPAWSPDGAELAYSSDQEAGNFEIYTTRADGSEQLNVTQNPGADYAPSWSPDGTQIAFSSTRDRSNAMLELRLPDYHRLQPAPNDILIMDAAGGAATNLTLAYEARTSLDPAWSTVSSRIAYCYENLPSMFDLVQDIVLTDAMGGEMVRLGVSGRHDFRTPSWSPDGTEIAFSSNAGRYWDICVIANSGGQPEVLTQSQGDNEHPSWSPVVRPPNTSVGTARWGEVKARLTGEHTASE